MSPKTRNRILFGYEHSSATFRYWKRMKYFSGNEMQIFFLIRD